MRRAVLVSLLAALGALSSAVSALADGPPPASGPAPSPAPAPAPQPGKLTLTVTSGMQSGGRRYVLTGSTVALAGRVTPYVAGQTLRLRISAPHRRPAVAHVRIGKGGAFATRFHARRAVTYTVYARHAATPQQALFAARAAVTAVRSGRPKALVLLKQGLRALGYPAGYGAAQDQKLALELLAFRKVNNMARVYRASRTIYAMVFAGRGTFKLRHPAAGKHVEADLSRQVVVLADKGRAVAIYPTSSGKPSTPTILGHYHFYSKTPGTNAKGMYMSNYFVRGYAIHGYPDVPTYNASHGCLRVPNSDAVSIFKQIDLGESIWVYP